MIALLRIIATAIFAILMLIFGVGYCLFSPRNPRHVFTIGGLFSKMAPIFGIKLELRLPEDAYKRDEHIYIGNHQNTWDLFTISAAITPRTVTVGKKSLVWIPLFGLIYWITGNILIDRNNKTKARGTINQVADEIKNNKVSVWMFPEGTRSRGRGLLPFKTGAFHAALAANVPIIPIVCSSTDKLSLNRWNNGVVIVEMMPPVSIDGYAKEETRALATLCRTQMKEKLALLDKEVADRNKK